MKNSCCPLFLPHVSCGFPSPADDYVETALDLNELVISHPAATFYVKVSGDSMKHAAICDGDIIVVDRALKASHNAIVLALVDGEFTVKRLHIDGDSVSLMPENPAYEPITLSPYHHFQVWGIVTYCIHRVV
jgi:DNA polymerase V